MVPGSNRGTQDHKDAQSGEEHQANAQLVTNVLRVRNVPDALPPGVLRELFNHVRRLVSLV